MKYPLTLLIFLLAFFFTPELAAQDSFYKAGYIIQQQDSVWGFIEKTDEIQLSQGVNFKANSTDETAKKLTVQDISGFGFSEEGQHFTAAPVEIRKESKVTTDTRFAKVMLTGFTSLYKLQLPIHDRVTIFKHDNTFIYLLRKDNAFYTLGRYEYRSGTSVGIEDRYKGMLLFLMSDCPAVSGTINYLEFRDRYLLKLVETYNTCKMPHLVSQKFNFQVKPVIKHGFAASYARLFFLLKPTEKTFGAIPYGYKLLNSNGVSAGYFFDVLRPDLNRRVSIATGMNYLYMQHKYRSGEGRWVYEQNVKTHSLRVPLMAQINLNKTEKAVSYPFFQLGFTNRFLTGLEFQAISYAPFLNLGAGFYANKLAFTLLIESTGVGLRSEKMLNVSVGYRLDK